MNKISSPRAVDYSKFGSNEIKTEAKYGLPGEIMYCRKCVISNQRPNSTVEYQHTKNSKKETIKFDEQGVCDACRFAETKIQNIDWKQREQELIALCNKYRKKDGSYDCLVPGSGGKDSFYAVHVLNISMECTP